MTSTRNEAIQARRQLNDWYSRFPDRAGQLGRKLRGAVNHEHLQALDELFVYQLLDATGRRVTYEEDGRGPDFRVYEGDRLLASVEVASLFEQAAWEDEGRRHARLADELNRRLDVHEGYFIDFKLSSDPRADPAPAKLAEWIQQQLDGLPQGSGKVVTGVTDVTCVVAACPAGEATRPR